jgi:hypothetical protein
MTKSKQQSYRYSICFKQAVVKEVSLKLLAGNMGLKATQR